MAKQKIAKNKGPKGKKARAKAKLDRQWGETSIIDDEKPRRVGKSRLLAKKGSEQKKIRWATKVQDQDGHDDHKISDPVDTPMDNGAVDFRGVLKNSNKKEIEEQKAPNSDSEMESDNDDSPALQGLLSSIWQSKTKGNRRKTKKRTEEPDKYNVEEVHEIPESDEELGKSDQDSSDDESEAASGNDMKIDELVDDDDDDGEDPTDHPEDKQSDLFYQHFGREPLKSEDIDKPDQKTSKVTMDDRTDLQISQRDNSMTLNIGNTGSDELKHLAESAFAANKKILKLRWSKMNKEVMKDTQYPIYPFLARYMDILAVTDSREKRKEMNTMYLLHILNHVLTTRSRVQRHNRQLKELEEKKKDGDEMENEIEQDRFRDQGFTRPTVLVLLPTRGTCQKFVHDLLRLLGAEENNPHVERFDVEFGKPEMDEDNESPIDLKKEMRRKEILEQKGKDWNALFGDDVNQDDDFKIGIALTPKAANAKRGDAKRTSNVQVKLYTDFYKSDIIVASPLGLKMLIVPDEDGKEGDTDFLSSIEICLVQQADVMMMQNWDHANDILNMMNQEPQKNNDTDFSRVRNYFLEGQAANWRQLILSTDIVDPFLLSAFKRFGKSVSGSVKMRWKVLPEEAALASVLVPMKQVFQRVPVSSFDQQTDGRVQYFVKNIFPQLQRHKQKHTLIYIPSYFDFVALRNIFLKREISFVSVHEYSRHTEVSRGRARFLQGRKPIMLYTGRCNFFHRHAIKGVSHLIFLGLPEHPHFYSEHVNLINTTSKFADDAESHSASSCLALFTKFEAHALERIVGSTNSSRILKSDKTTFMFHS